MKRKKNQKTGSAALKFRLYPTSEQASLITQTAGCQRKLWNILVGRDKQEGFFKVNIPAIKEEFSYMKNYDSLAFCNTSLNFFQALEMRKEAREKGQIYVLNFKKKSKRRYSYTTNNVNNNIKIKDNKVKLPKINGWIKFVKHRPFPKDSRLKHVTVSRNPDGKFYVSFVFEVRNSVRPKQVVKTGLGLDYSSHDFYVDNEGKIANYPRYYRKAEKRLAKAQRILGRRQKGSKRYERQRKLVAIIQEKIENQRKNFLHNLSNSIAKNYDLVAVEDINLQGLAQTLNLGKSTNDNGFGMFRTFLAYKLKREGGYFVKVDKWFASSQTCHCCGFKNKATKDLSVREWNCLNCGCHHNRDQNAAINILKKGIETFIGGNAPNGKLGTLVPVPVQITSPLL